MKTSKKAALVVTVAGMAAVAASGSAFADSGAKGAAVKSPGVISGNVAQVPLHVPLQASGNSINVIGLLNPAFGNAAVNN